MLKSSDIEKRIESLEKEIGELDSSISYLENEIRRKPKARYEIKKVFRGYRADSFNSFDLLNPDRGSASFGKQTVYSYENEVISKEKFLEINKNREREIMALRDEIELKQSKRELKKEALKQLRIEAEKGGVNTDISKIISGNTISKMQGTQEGLNKRGANIQKRLSVKEAIRKVCAKHGYKPGEYNSGIQKKYTILFNEVNELLVTPTTEKNFRKELSQEGYTGRGEG